MSHDQKNLRDGRIDVDAGGLAVIIVLLGMIYGLCMGSYSLLKEVPEALCAQRSQYALQAIARDDDQSAGAVLSDAVGHVSVTVRVQCAGRIAADAAERA